MSGGGLEGVVLGYRRGTNTQYPNEVLVKFHRVESRSDASRLIGCKVIYKDVYGNVFRGKIVGVHGRKGVVRAVFKPNLPGQAIGRGTVILVARPGRRDEA